MYNVFNDDGKPMCLCDMSWEKACHVLAIYRREYEGQPYHNGKGWHDVRFFIKRV